ncbi:MAG TPA: DUF2169 domain-containing protein [Pirellulales bacterium]|nr:DUF2169 domain-containing protein [Pirellulales bacterium]
MHLVNHTKLLAGYTMAVDRTGRESLVVVAKGTFTIPDRSEQSPALVAEQMPLVMCDEFTGEPGFSSTRYEVDFAPHKPRCDVLLNGSAYAAQGRPTDRVTVTLRVGPMTKSFNVVGNRKYQAGIVRITGGSIEPFLVMPISYDNAYGGIERSHDDPAKHRWFRANPAGRGYHAGATVKAIEGKPLPNTEETSAPITSANGSYRPMALGAVGRSWQGRIEHAGTYDKRWLDEKLPFLPDDFSDRYFQAAPDDQQIDYLAGGEEVTLTNLTPQGQTAFRLPKRLGMPATFYLRTGEIKEQPMVADTLLIEPDKQRFMITWRTSLALRRGVAEVVQMDVGRAVAASASATPQAQVAGS